MSWIQELYRTYDNCVDIDEQLTPPYHMRNNTQIEVRIDGNGSFLGAKFEELKNTIIPCTEKSEAARTMNPPSHPLCDKLQFVAADYNGNKTSYFSKYHDLLGQWANSEFSHPMVKAVFTYINKRSLINDLRTFGDDIIKADEDPADLFVRWRIEIPGENETRTWKSKSLFESWKDFYESQESLSGLCMVTGKEKVLAINHPKRIRHGGDGGKLISSNDRTGFTFRGRFTTDEVIIDGKKTEVAIQSASVSAEVSQKAHRALSWLVARQGFRNGDQVFVSWSVTGEDKPDEFADTISLFDDSDEEKINELVSHDYYDAGQRFARKLSKKIAGYRTSLTNAKKIVVLGLDSAGPGRISITFYRELAGSEFLDRLEKWHNDMAWYFYEFIPDPIEKKKKYSGFITYAPSPLTIIDACYGKRPDEKLKKSSVERLLPCILEGRQVPSDLVNSAVRKASNRIALDHWAWLRTLSVACSLYSCQNLRNSQNKNKLKVMALERQRTDRDYLFGRLLAVAEYIEERALYLANEKRETNAARMMYIFSEHPFTTWQKLYDRIAQGYFSRLQARRPEFLFRMKNLIGEINCLFLPGDFEKKEKLSGLYLLGYHCQRMALVSPDTKEQLSEEETTN
ncbi:MAG TPA: type I-C CRISPR-associated protein Cas8c/Csd1 [Bacteroidales bacterium]|nr:type I-C CRISPR-associated protein Cas8c/Csd1 [Bacteroidales bacterium]